MSKIKQIDFFIILLFNIDVNLIARNPKMKKRILISAIISTITLSGCSLSPKFEKPEVNMDLHKDIQVKNKTVSNYVNDDMIQSFKDNNLREIIISALNKNKDLEIALLSAQKLKSLYQIEESNSFPDISGSFDYDNERVSKNASASGKAYTDENFGLNVGFTNYELDLFGKNKNESDSAVNEYLSSEAGYNSFRISLTSQIAKNFYELAYLVEQKILKENLIKNLKETTDVSKHLFKMGLGPKIIYTGIEEEYQRELLLIEDITFYIDEKKSLINFLTVSNNDFTYLDKSSKVLLSSEVIGMGKEISSDVLLSRPDVLEAEYSIKMANANIGVARAMFYPQIGLTTSVGLRSSQLSNLFDSNSIGWNFSPFIKLPLFTGGRLQANLEYSEADKKQKISEYQKTVQNAFMEVNNILKFKEKNNNKIIINETSLKNIKENYKRHLYNHKMGLIGKADVLLTERQMLKSQLVRLELERNKISNNIDFFKAVGGNTNLK